MAFKRSAVRSRLTPPFIFPVDFTADSSKNADTPLSGEFANFDQI